MSILNIWTFCFCHYSLNSREQQLLRYHLQCIIYSKSATGNLEYRGGLHRLYADMAASLRTDSELDFGMQGSPDVSPGDNCNCF